MTPIILTGDSHLAALRRGVDLLASAQMRDRFVFWPFGTGSIARARFHQRNPEDGSIIVDPQPLPRLVFSPETIAQVGEDARLVVSLPLHSARFLRRYGWNTHAPWRLADSTIALSDRVLEAMIDADSRHPLDFIRDLVRILPRVSVLEPPRLFATANLLDKVRPEVLTTLEETYRARIRVRLAEMEVSVIDQPPETVTPDHMTDLAYDNENPDDQHHANKTYGSLALDAILRHVDGIPA